MCRQASDDDLVWAIDYFANHIWANVMNINQLLVSNAADRERVFLADISMLLAQTARITPLNRPNRKKSAWPYRVFELA
jgi:hypothetical protein